MVMISCLSKEEKDKLKKKDMKLLGQIEKLEEKESWNLDDEMK